MDPKKVAILSKYMPEPAAQQIASWIDSYQCEFKISKGRNTKFGDYRPPFQNKAHRISVNHNLNPYAFLITTVHEFAHLSTWNRYQNKVKPHGVEWKTSFQNMMRPFFDMGIFPDDVEKAVVNYLRNPAASSCSDKVLFRTLKKYDPLKEGLIMVEQIAENELFEMENGRVFKKLNKIRTRYRCLEVQSGKFYLFNPLAEVRLVG